MNRFVLFIIAFSVFMGLTIGCNLEAFKGLSRFCSLVRLGLGYQISQILVPADAYVAWNADTILSGLRAQTISHFKALDWPESDEARNAPFPSKMPYTSRQTFGSDLHAIREVSLLNLRDNFIFRILYLPFHEHPLCMRLEGTPDGKAVLFVKESYGKSRFCPGDTIVERKIQLSAQDYGAFSKEFGKANFFKKTVEGKNETGYETFGGSMWLFEANQFGQYHCLDRNSDTYDDGNLRQITLMLLKRAAIFRDVH